MFPAKELYDNRNCPVRSNLLAIDRRYARRPPSATRAGVGRAAFTLRPGGFGRPWAGALWGVW